MTDENKINIFIKYIMQGKNRRPGIWKLVFDDSTRFVANLHCYQTDFIPLYLIEYLLGKDETENRYGRISQAKQQYFPENPEYFYRHKVMFQIGEYLLHNKSYLYVYKIEFNHWFVLLLLTLVMF